LNSDLIFEIGYRKKNIVLLTFGSDIVIRNLRTYFDYESLSANQIIFITDPPIRVEWKFAAPS
jgi:hypothetical protein